MGHRRATVLPLTDWGASPRLLAVLNIWDGGVCINEVALGQQAASLSEQFQCVGVDWLDRGFEDWHNQTDALDLRVLDGIVFRISSSESLWLDGEGEIIGQSLSDVAGMIGEEPEVDFIEDDLQLVPFRRSGCSCVVLFGRVTQASIDAPDLIQD